MKIPGTSSRQDFFESASSQNRDFEGTSTSDELSQLLLNLLKVNGSPLLDITLDISPRNSSKYLGVIRVPGKAAILPRLAHSRKDFAIFSRRWVRNVSNVYKIIYPLLVKHMYTYKLMFVMGFGMYLLGQNQAQNKDSSWFDKK